MPSTICVLGDNLAHAVWLLDLLCRENADDICKRYSTSCIMNDGTRLIATSIGDHIGFQGQSFDYIFYEDGRMDYYCRNYGGVMEHITRLCLARSQAPQEFRWSKVNIFID